MQLAALIKKRSRLELAFAAVFAAWLVLSFTGAAPALTALLGVAGLILGIAVLFRLCRYLVRQSIWRLRNRLIVTYLFIGVVPIVLILILCAIGGYIVAGQVAVFLVSTELDRRIEALNQPAQILGWSTRETHARVLNQMSPVVRSHFPAVQMLIHADQDYVSPSDAKLTPPPAGWADNVGLVIKDGLYYGWAHVSREQTEVVLIEPITHRVLSELVPHLGEVHLLSEPNTSVLTSQDEEHGTTHLPRAQNAFDREVTWMTRIPVADWNRPGSLDKHILMVTTRPFAVIGAIFGEQFDIGQLSLMVFLAVAALFLLVELASAVVGISLARTITRAVHNLYDGMQKVTAGNFSHRVEVHGRDQLGELTASFNGMTENLERLFVVEKEKERLQSELEIAKEVQYQLFPKDVPLSRTMELRGLCKPARMVSGDYYDFMCLEDNLIAFAIGDVAGKGISAALLMASIQSIMRTQLAVGHHLVAAANGPTTRCYDTSHAVTQLNTQLFASTSPEKFATFCFGIYNEDSRVLHYTNAGHLPPVLIRAGDAHLLEVTGTVVGAFPKVKYEERRIALQKGDMLVAYTDGIAEPENEYGEEFGQDRLVDLLVKNHKMDSKEIIASVMDAVQQWTTAPELPDDMTVLVAKIH